MFLDVDVASYVVTPCYVQQIFCINKKYHHFHLVQYLHCIQCRVLQMASKHVNYEQQNIEMNVEFSPKLAPRKLGLIFE